MGTLTASYQVELNSGLGWADISSYLVGTDAVQTRHDTTGTRSGFAFGDDSTSEATVKIRRAYGSVARLWGLRITYTINSVSRRIFTGVIKTYSGDAYIWTLSCQGYSYLLDKSKPFTAMVEGRPAFTATTATSIEDPTNGSYAAGHGNMLLWLAGGRPYEQSSTYTNPAFYYSCEQALIVIPYAWSAGDSAHQELLKLCQATAGQLYQDGAGVVRYKQPFSFAATAGSWTFDATVGAHDPALAVTPHGDPDQQYPDAELATKITCNYIPRQKQVYQVVVEDTTKRHVDASGTLVIPLSPKYPITTDALIIASDGINATFMAGGKVVPNDGTLGYTYTTTQAAQQITLTFTNHTAQPFYINKITIQARPVVALEAGVVSSGSGSEEQLLSDNPNIQVESQAQRLCTIGMLYYAQERPILWLKNVPYIPQIVQGMGAVVNQPLLGLSNVLHTVVAIDETQTGLSADYGMIDVTGIPTTNLFYQWGTAYTGSDTKKIGY